MLKKINKILQIEATSIMDALIQMPILYIDEYADVESKKQSYLVRAPQQENCYAIGIHVDLDPATKKWQVGYSDLIVGEASTIEEALYMLLKSAPNVFAPIPTIPNDILGRLRTPEQW